MHDQFEFGASPAALMLYEHFEKIPNRLGRKKVARTLSVWGSILNAAASVSEPIHNGPNCRKTLLLLVLNRSKEVISEMDYLPGVVRKGMCSIMHARYRILLGIPKPK